MSHHVCVIVKIGLRPLKNKSEKVYHVSGTGISHHVYFCFSELISSALFSLSCKSVLRPVYVKIAGNIALDYFVYFLQKIILIF